MRPIARRRIQSWCNWLPDLHLPLLTSLAVKRPAFGGGSYATFARASAATVSDFEGVIKEARAGEARFKGARRVENLVNTSSLAIGGAGWSVTSGATIDSGIADPSGGTDAARVNKGSSVDGDVLANNSARVTENIYGRKFVTSLWVKGEGSDIGKTCNITCKRSSGTFAAAQVNITLTGAWQRVSTGVFTGLSDSLGIKMSIYMDGTTCQSVLVYGVQIEEVSGQTIQLPSEYITVGALPAPYHGAGVDGVKYFDYRNGNSVASGIVTDARGESLPTPDGLLCEGGRTNLETNTGTVQVIGGTVVPATSVLDPMGRQCTLQTEDTGPTSSGHYSYVASPAITSGQRYTLSLYVKAGTATKCQLASTASAYPTTTYANFDLTAMTILATGATAINPFIEDAGNGWRRIGWSADATAAGGGAGIILSTISTDTDARLTNFVGSGRTIYRSMGMYEGGETTTLSFASSYLPTATVSATRAADDCQYVCNYGVFQGDFSIGFGYWIDRVVALADRRSLGASGNTTTRFQMVCHNNSATPITGFFFGDGSAVSYVDAGPTAQGRGYLAASLRSRNPSPIAMTPMKEARHSAANNGVNIAATQFSIGNAGGVMFAPIRNVVMWNQAIPDDVLRQWGKSL